MICERILLSNRLNSGTKFVCVRFCNVVGSRGSVVPLFKERLEQNKPVLIEFIADKTGTFTFKCNVPCGSGHKTMAGTLIVK